MGRLDYEENDQFKLAIVKFIYPVMENDLGIDLQKFVRKMCKFSRNGALDFHRLLCAPSKKLKPNGSLKELDTVMPAQKICKSFNLMMA